MRTLVRATDRISHFCGALAAVLVIVLVVLMLYDVVLRYVFNAPTTWGNDLNTFLMGGSFVLSIAYALSTDAHVRVDLLYNERTRPRLAYVDLIGMTLIVLPAVAIISWGLLDPPAGWHTHRRAHRLGGVEPCRVAVSRRDVGRAS